MEAIVSSQITQTGSVISGDTTMVVDVAVDPGYAGNPGHPGTGIVVGVECGGHSCNLIATSGGPRRLTTPRPVGENRASTFSPDSRRRRMPWKLEGSYFETCSCNVVCPCTASFALAPPSTAAGSRWCST